MKADATVANCWRAAMLERTAADLERDLKRSLHFKGPTEDPHGWLTPREYTVDEVVAGANAPQVGL